MLCMAKGFVGKFLQENFEKWCNLGCFGVYFDQMFLKIIPKNYHFYIKTNIYGVFKLSEKMLKPCDQHFDVFFDKIWYYKRSDCYYIEIMML